jgi:Domain of unknown function (DUF5911)
MALDVRVDPVGRVVSGGARRAPRARYLPIAEHGLIGDLHTVALVGTDGTIDWYCCPRFDSPSVFAAILDADRGGLFRTSLECVHAFRRIPSKCRLQARLAPGLLHLGGHGDIAAEARCVQDACGRSRSERSGKTTSMSRRGRRSSPSEGSLQEPRTAACMRWLQP